MFRLARMRNDHDSPQLYSEPGITRKRQGSHWAYFGPDGTRIADRDEIERLNAIGLPPAYVDGWF